MIYQPVIARDLYFNSIRQAAKELHLCSKYIRRRCKSNDYPDYYYTTYQIPINKKCSTCNKIKKLDEFYNNKNTRDLKSCDCKKCSNKASSKSKRENFSFYKNHRLLQTYNLSLEEYNNMFQSQNGRCVICNIHQKDLYKSLVVDHDHITGKIRGLLCSICNLGISNLKEDENIILNAMLYIKNNK